MKIIKTNFIALFSTIACLTPKLKLSILTLLFGLLPLPALANYKVQVSPRPSGEIITLKVEVLDENNVPIEDLKKSDFKIEAAKLNQTLSVINRMRLIPPGEQLKPEPAYVVILLDMSGSMQEQDANKVKKIDGAISAIREYIKLVRDNNLPVSIALVPFGEGGRSKCNYEVNQQIIAKSFFLANNQELEQKVTDLSQSPTCSATNLYEPLKAAVQYLGNPDQFKQSENNNELDENTDTPQIPPKVAVILLSDGYHNKNRETEETQFAEVEKVLKENPAVRVYALGYGESLQHLRDRAYNCDITNYQLTQNNAVDLISKCRLSGKNIANFIVDQPRLKQIADLGGGISQFPDNATDAVNSLETFFKALRYYELQYKQVDAEPAEEYQVKVSVNSASRKIDASSEPVTFRIPNFSIQLPLIPDRLIILTLTLAALGGTLWWFKGWSEQLKKDAERWL
ncbi:MAG: vWA domain-containing protein [Nostoc sp. DedQUE12a]|nr:vWA domain-containing protein [Nostoc sp. DedQUE12a]